MEAVGGRRGWSEVAGPHLTLCSPLCQSLLFSNDTHEIQVHTPTPLCKDQQYSTIRPPGGC